MQLAAYAPVLHLLREADCQILVIATGTPAYAAKFIPSLGFELPGTILFDPKRATHRACGLTQSVYASLVMPFRKHLRTFGKQAVAEALRVSLKNATAGHGSSWQQGGTFVLDHPSGAAVQCTFAWREEYPGDWRPIEEVLADGLGITQAPTVDFPERLDFVIKSRKSSGAEQRPCTDDACDLKALRELKQGSS